VQTIHKQVFITEGEIKSQHLLYLTKGEIEGWLRTRSKQEIEVKPSLSCLLSLANAFLSLACLP
jgi:hypothetical protein